jgi:hypothetical protein
MQVSMDERDFDMGGLRARFLSHFLALHIPSFTLFRSLNTRDKSRSEL